jgi:hypothetical protein
LAPPGAQHLPGSPDPWIWLVAWPRDREVRVSLKSKAAWGAAVEVRKCALGRETVPGVTPIVRPSGVCDNPVVVFHRQEVRPMYAVSVRGAPLQAGSRD